MEPLVSIVIPAKNSAKTIEPCLASIKEQSYKSIETIVAYGVSVDETMRILQSSKCQIIVTNFPKLSARYEGFKKSRGGYVLMLDSDQILERTTIERSLPLFRHDDIICLEEMSYKAKTFVEKLFEADRRVIHQNSTLQIDPVYGTLHARFYRREVLAKAFKRIPESLIPSVRHRDDAIINYEARKITDRVSVLPNAVWHIEISNLTELWKKNFAYGRALRQLRRQGYYNELLKGKMHLRITNSKISKDKFLSTLLLLLKAPPYFVGAYL